MCGVVRNMHLSCSLEHFFFYEKTFLSYWHVFNDEDTHIFCVFCEWKAANFIIVHNRREKCVYFAKFSFYWVTLKKNVTIKGIEAECLPDPSVKSVYTTISNNMDKKFLGSRLIFKITFYNLTVLVGDDQAVKKRLHCWLKRRRIRAVRIFVQLWFVWVGWNDFCAAFQYFFVHT